MELNTAGDSYETTSLTRPRLENECDWICNCPANDTAERVAKETREQIAQEITEYCSIYHTEGRSLEPCFKCSITVEMIRGK